jgi:CTP synthase
VSKKDKKFIFITGGVTSSLGKGLAAASIGNLMEKRGVKIGLLKMDPYINVDPGTMSPTQHGEVFVTDDGAETDLDLGHYERFTSLKLEKRNNFTTGQVYLQVIENERDGKYLGKTVQVVPHITDEIKRRIKVAAEGTELLIGEIGGTIGDIESLPFLEAIRQFAQEVGSENVLFIHLVLVPYLKAASELKSKPAQHSIKELRSLGLIPEIIILRGEREIDENVIDKISLFGNIPKKNVFQSLDQELIYSVPLEFHKQGLDQRITESLGMWTTTPDMSSLEKVVANSLNPVGEIKVGIVGKYTELIESYKSLDEALKHAASLIQVKITPIYIDAEKDDLETKLRLVDGVLVPGGFGERGTEGKIKAIEIAREQKIPFFGICLGMQLAVIEFARNVAGIPEASSEEFGSKGDLIVHYMEGQKEAKKGASMRLGAYDCTIQIDSLAYKIYESQSISERHRHRLEINNLYKDKLLNAGLIISGTNDKYNLVEIIEIKDHPYFIGCQFHPEFKSKPEAPHKLFESFTQAMKDYSKGSK